MTATLSLQDARYQSAASVNRLFEQTIAKMREAPGVENAAVCLTLPYERALNIGGRWADAKAGDGFGLMNMTYVTPGYFETLRIPIVRGRVFSDADTASGMPVMVVNQTFVKRFSPDQDPIGRQVAQNPLPRTIIGVVGDIQQKAGFGTYGPVGIDAAPPTFPRRRRRMRSSKWCTRGSRRAGSCAWPTRSRPPPPRCSAPSSRSIR